MKTIKFKAILIFVLAATISLTSCLNETISDIGIISNYAGFDFKTTKEVLVNVKTLTNANDPMNGVSVQLFSKNPLNENGSLVDNYQDILIYKGQTCADGQINVKIAPATTIDTLYLLASQIGLSGLQKVSLNSNEINVVFGGSAAQGVKVNSKVFKSNALIGEDGVNTISDYKIVSGLYTFSDWSSLGVPNLLEKTNDVITKEFLADVNASLPEYKALPVSHPQYFDGSTENGNVVLEKDAQVWVTFVHEGASYTNTVAYYTYPTGNPPASTKDIKYSTIAFPNASFLNSSGGLASGNKIKLYYFDTERNLYTEKFPAGTTVAWILRSNAWDTKTSTVKTGLFTYYSDAALNPESDSKLKKHNIILKDDNRQLLLVGFEDVRRDNGSDNDFNDAVFYATVYPYSAVKSGIYQKIDTPNDRDGDGVSDSSDEYPDDSKKAHNNYTPSKGQNGTLAFEDLWPYKGDYDFNDMVVDYNFNQITNAQNNVVEIDATLTLRAIGAHFKNGFAIELNTAPDNIASVTGQILNKNIFKIGQNGTENNQEKAVIFAFDDAFSVMSPNDYSSYINTVIGGIYLTPKTINLKITFTNPVSTAILGGAPFNPFIVVNGEREKEVHLAGSAPTKLADLSLFGTGQDNSNVATGKYYMSDKYLPWALNIPVQFDYPAEKEDITKTYLMFNNWAQSKGTTNTDWYTNKSGNRDIKRLYIK
ncbi:MAG: LruC domain-containing protein [Paludibacter sp.]